VSFYVSCLFLCNVSSISEYLFIFNVFLEVLIDVLTVAENVTPLTVNFRDSCLYAGPHLETLLYLISLNSGMQRPKDVPLKKMGLTAKTNNVECSISESHNIFHMFFLPQDPDHYSR
jgi:hypothetical protein